MSKPTTPKPATRKPTTVNCPTCQKTVAWVTENTFKPFCSERCKLIDLGEWAAEEKRIPGESAHLPEQNNDQDDF